MKAQELYDLRERFAFCSGMDLHEYFQGELGDMSPSGHCEIDEVKARQFVQSNLGHMKANSLDTLGGLYTTDEQCALEKFITG